LELKDHMSKMQQGLKSYEEFFEEFRTFVESQMREEKRRRVMYDILDKASPNWQEPYLATLRHKPLTKETRKKIDESLELLSHYPDTGDNQ